MEREGKGEGKRRGKKGREERRESEEMEKMKEWTKGSENSRGVVRGPGELLVRCPRRQRRRCLLLRSANSSTARSGKRLRRLVITEFKHN